MARTYTGVDLLVEVARQLVACDSTYTEHAATCTDNPCVECNRCARAEEAAFGKLRRVLSEFDGEQA